MDYLATDTGGSREPGNGAERREAPRFASLIRAAKLVSPGGEFVCVIRDVSMSGIGLRTFHRLPPGDLMLTLQNGDCYPLALVRANGAEASFTFAGEVDLDRLIVETSKFPKRQLRINLSIPTVLATATQRFNAVIHNLSQQGALIECDAMFAIEQPIRLEARQMPHLRAKVRWRTEEAYGLAFDTTFSLREFAELVASLQCPELLAG